MAEKINPIPRTPREWFEHQGKTIENVDKQAEVELKELIANNEDLLLRDKVEKSLKDKLEKLQDQIIWLLDKITDWWKIKSLLDWNELSNKEKKALLSVLEKNKVWKNYEKQKGEEVKKEIAAFKRELTVFQSQVMEWQSWYKSENLRSSSREVLQQSVEWKVWAAWITEQEMEDLRKILGWKDIIWDNEKVMRNERKLRRHFMHAVELIKENTSISFSKVLESYSLLLKKKTANPDWDAVFQAKGRKWTDKEKATLTRWYDAYLESKKSNTETSRWNLLMDTLERWVLNEWKRLWVVYNESLNQTISKKERKAWVRVERAVYEGQDSTPQAKTDWINNYLNTHKDEIAAKQQEWKEAWYTGPQIRNMVKDYLESKYKKRWKSHVKDLEAQWVQESDIWKYRVLVDSIDKKSSQEKILALISDTNFDGMRNHLDWMGIRRWQQIDAAFHIALENGKSLKDIVNNIWEYLTLLWVEISPKDYSSPDSFAKWLSSDVLNARKVQRALMDTPAEAVDIFQSWKDAMSKTLESQEVPVEFIREVKKSVDSNPEIKWLSQAARENVATTLSNVLYQWMRDRDVSTNVNWLGIWVDVPLSQILKWLHFQIWAWTTFDGGNYLWAKVSFDRKLIKWKTWNINWWVNAWTTLWVIPIYWSRIGISQDLNTKKVLWDIDPRAVTSVNFWWNFTMLGPIPSWGLSAWFEKEDIKWIKDHYENLKTSGLKMMTDILDMKDRSLDSIKKYLKEKFKESSDASIEKQAKNFVSVLNLIKPLEAKAKEQGNWDKVKSDLARIISEWYSNSWKNNAVSSLPKWWTFTWANAWVQFLAWFFPLWTLSATLTKYRNESYEDSPESKQRMRQQIDRGIGNETMPDVQWKYLDQMTKQLRVSNILRENEKIDMNKDGTVNLPISVLSRAWLSVMINKDLKWFVKVSEDKKTIVLPQGISYRFFKAARTHWVTTVFNIWGDSNRWMVALTADNMNEFVWLKDYQETQYLAELTKQLNNLKANWSAELKAVLKNVRIENWHLKIWESDEWVITKWKWILVSMKWESSTIGVCDKKWISIENSWVLVDADIEGHVDHIFTNEIVSKIVEWVKNNKWRASNLEKLWDFYWNSKEKKLAYLAAASDVQWMFSWNELFASIVDAVACNGEWVNKKFKTPGLAHQVIDRLKAIFATIPLDQKWNKDALKNTVKRRNTEFIKNNKQTVLEKFSDGKLHINYEDIPDRLESFSPVLQDNLVWYTAFYRRWKAFSDSRGMSMTAVWQTSVLWRTFEISNEENPSAVKEWIINNLKKEEVVQIQTLSRKIWKVGNPNEKWLDNAGYLGRDNVLKLLEKWTIKVGSKTISLDVKPVKYLLAECANESIGIQLENIVINDETPVVVEGWKWSNNFTDTGAISDIDAKRFTAWIAFWWKKKQEEAPKEDDVISNPGDNLWWGVISNPGDNLDWATNSDGSNVVIDGGWVDITPEDEAPNIPL